MSADLGWSVGIGLRARAYEPGPAVRGRAIGRGLRAAATYHAERGRAIGRGLAAFAERWFVVYEDTTGELQSVGTIVGTLPPGFTSEEVVGPPDNDEVWDQVTRAFVPREKAGRVDLLDEIMSDGAFPTTVTVPERIEVRDVLEDHVEDAWRYS